MKQPVVRMQKVYVKVTSDFDATGFMQPRTITWSDGRVFQIEAVKDFRPAGANHDSLTCGCYTVVIKGEIKYLFFEKANTHHVSSVGRWYVECPVVIQ